MNRDRTYLIQILERIDRIEDYTKGGRSSFMKSRQIQDAVIRNFEVMGEIAKRISIKIKKESRHIDWKKIAGFRDILIHEYDRIFLEKVWDIVDVNLPKLKQQVIKIVKAHFYRLDDDGSMLAETRALYNRKMKNLLQKRSK